MYSIDVIQPLAVPEVQKIVRERVPLYLCPVAAGFPSPADDHLDKVLDLNEYLVQHPASTYFARASGDSMEGAKIYHDDILVVDRSVTPEQGSVVIAAVNGELTCKILDIKNRRLVSANASYPPIPLPEETDLVIEGVVVHVIRHLRKDACSPW